MRMTNAKRWDDLEIKSKGYVLILPTVYALENDFIRHINSIFKSGIINNSYISLVFMSY